MPRRYFKIGLHGGAEIHVFFETMGGLIIEFVVKLILRIDDKCYDVVRFDSAHGCPHKDILGVDGKVKRKVWFELLDNKQGLDVAI